MAVPIRWIRNTGLRPGMTVLREKADGKFAVDCRLRNFFVTSPRFPELAFTTDTHTVVFSRCGHSWVTYT